MKRFLALAAGGLGLGALLRRRSARSAEPLESPADELRAKLAESRAVVDEREVDEAGETPVDEVADAAPTKPASARRRDVHERARKATDELG